MLCNILGKDVDRLPILVSGIGAEQLLSVLEITGQSIATSVDCAIKDWNLRNQMKGMCFDTTSSNTGCKNGACVLLEQKLDIELLHFACCQMVHALTNITTEEHPPKRAFVDPCDIQKKCLYDFITYNTKRFSRSHGISAAFQIRTQRIGKKIAIFVVL